ncbi:Adenosine 5'-monophosphoramidase [Batrachochytrium dendrobatidis]|nr:Adenosine 5'-monophosphoramidase [Batrachochytrium dendrobatidis]
MSASCLFCKGVIPSHKVLENELVYAFLDINPLSKGHLVIPKYHAQFVHQVPDDALAAIGPAIKKVALALGAENYNVLQNNGRLAHQEVDHVHFHVIPKDEQFGLGINWPITSLSQPELAKIAEDISGKIANL